MCVWGSERFVHGYLCINIYIWEYLKFCCASVLYPECVLACVCVCVLGLSRTPCYLCMWPSSLMCRCVGASGRRALHKTFISFVKWKRRKITKRKSRSRCLTAVCVGLELSSNCCFTVKCSLPVKINSSCFCFIFFSLGYIPFNFACVVPISSLIPILYICKQEKKIFLFWFVWHFLRKSPFTECTPSLVWVHSCRTFERFLKKAGSSSHEF